MIHSTDLFKNTNSFRNETSDWLYEWVIKSFIQPIGSKTCSGMQQETVFTSLWIIHLTDSFKTRDCLYDWIIESFICSKALNHLEKTLLLYVATVQKLEINWKYCMERSSKRNFLFIELVYKSKITQTAVSVFFNFSETAQALVADMFRINGSFKKYFTKYVMLIKKKECKVYFVGLLICKFYLQIR